jgi:hypothetical protein
VAPNDSAPALFQHSGARLIGSSYLVSESCQLRAGVPTEFNWSSQHRSECRVTHRAHRHGHRNREVTRSVCTFVNGLADHPPRAAISDRAQIQPGFPGTQIGASGAPHASRRPPLRPPRRRDGRTASMLKTVPPRVIPKIPPLRVMPQRRPPRVISQPAPLRVVGVGENCRQGGRRAEDLHVARCLTGGRSPRVEPGLLTRRRRSIRCGGDRHRSNRGCKQRYVVVHPRSHDHVPFDVLGMIPRPAAIELPRDRQLLDIGGFTHAITASLTTRFSATRWCCGCRSKLAKAARPRISRTACVSAVSAAVSLVVGWCIAELAMC